VGSRRLTALAYLVRLQDRTQQRYDLADLRVPSTIGLIKLNSNNYFGTLYAKFLFVYYLCFIDNVTAGKIFVSVRLYSKKHTFYREALG
jgi:hypothetical protein